MKEVNRNRGQRPTIVLAAVSVMVFAGSGRDAPGSTGGRDCDEFAPPGPPQMLIAPVSPPEGEAAYPVGTVIDGQEIWLPAEVDEVWLEVTVQNWGGYPFLRGSGGADAEAGAKPGEYEPVSPEGNVSFVYGACCTFDDNYCYENVYDWATCYEEYAGYSYCPGLVCAECLCSNPQVSVITVIRSTTRALPSPACHVARINEDDPCLVRGGGFVLGPEGACMPTPEFKYEYMAEYPGVIDYGFVAYLGTMEFRPNGPEWEPARGSRGVRTFVVELDPGETVILDQHGEPIPYTVVPAVVIIGEGGAIPTVSEWGLVILALLLLVAAKGYFGRRAAKRV